MRFAETRLHSITVLQRPKARHAGIVAVLISVALVPVVSKAFFRQSSSGTQEVLSRPMEYNELQLKGPAQTAPQFFNARNASRQKQVEHDSARMIKLAADLKQELDKTGRSSLSASEIRKAEAIEKLAHSIKAKMATP